MELDDPKIKGFPLAIRREIVNTQKFGDRIIKKMKDDRRSREPEIDDRYVTKQEFETVLTAIADLIFEVASLLPLSSETREKLIKKGDGLIK